MNPDENNTAPEGEAVVPTPTTDGDATATDGDATATPEVEASM